MVQWKILQKIPNPVLFSKLVRSVWRVQQGIPCWVLHFLNELLYLEDDTGVQFAVVKFGKVCMQLNHSITYIPCRILTFFNSANRFHICHNTIYSKANTRTSKKRNRTKGTEMGRERDQKKYSASHSVHVASRTTTPLALDRDCPQHFSRCTKIVNVGHFS